MQNAPSYIFIMILNTSLDDTSRLDRSKKIVIVKTKCFYSITNNLKSKQNQKILRHSSIKIIYTNSSGFMVGSLSWRYCKYSQEIFIKNSHWYLKLSRVALSSVIKCSPQKWKQHHQKDASQLRKNKEMSHP